MNRHYKQKLLLSKNKTPYLLICLFLLLLAFFILLNATAKFEASKVRGVLISLAETFQTNNFSDGPDRSILPVFGKLLSPEAFLSKIKYLWVSFVERENLTTSHTPNNVQIILSANELFLGGETQLRSDRHDLLNRTANALSAETPGFVSYIQLIFSCKNEPSRRMQNDTELAIKRAEVLAQKIIDFGAPASRVSLGLYEGKENSVLVKFGINNIGQLKYKLQRLVQ